uniref:Cystathionine gamma-synthase n=1 Tax=Fusarium oxysporum (strain Fo5176) TaxID=660025 RepID=A0A0D2XI89_FUSOF
MPLFSNRGRELPEAILPIQEAREAKIAMKQRIADSLSTKDNKLKNSDVLLYPTGMSDISHIHDIISLYTTARKRTVAIFGKTAQTDFEERVIKASQNAQHIADILRKHSSVGQVYYPKGSPTQQLHEKYKRPGKGYGYLLSIRFKTPAAAIAFHDALDVAKGPSLGTNFTLGCAYTLFAHYDELEWAEEYGVVKHLVRISVGIENERFLDEVIKTALDAAERAKISHQNLIFTGRNVSSCVTLSLAYVRLIRDDPNDKHKFLAGSSLDISTRLELSIYVFPRGLNRSGGVTGYNPVAHNWKSIFGSTTTSYLTEY